MSQLSQKNLFTLRSFNAELKRNCTTRGYKIYYSELTGLYTILYTTKANYNKNIISSYNGYKSYYFGTTYNPSMLYDLLEAAQIEISKLSIERLEEQLEVKRRKLEYKLNPVVYKYW